MGMVRVGIFTIILLLFSSFISIHAQSSLKMEQSEITPAPDLLEEDSFATESAAVVDTGVDYELSYPGMLPDNPLYFLKTIRDAIVRFLIKDPLKKTEFYILTADKRIFAAALLTEKDKYDIALETVSKSNNYLHEAVFSLSKAQSAGKNILPLRDTLNTAVKKHQEVVSQQIEPFIPEDKMEILQNEIKRLEVIKKSVNAIKSK